MSKYQLWINIIHEDLNISKCKVQIWFKIIRKDLKNILISKCNDQSYIQSDIILQDLDYFKMS